MIKISNVLMSLLMMINMGITQNHYQSGLPKEKDISVVKSILRKYPMTELERANGSAFLTDFFKISREPVEFYRSSDPDIMLEMISMEYDNDSLGNRAFDRFKGIINNCIKDIEEGTRNCLFIEDGLIIFKDNKKIFIILIATYRNAKTYKSFYEIVKKIKRSKTSYLYWIEGYAWGESDSANF